MNEEEKLKDLKAVYSGAVQSGEIGIANMIKGGIDLIEKLQKECIFREDGAEEGLWHCSNCHNEWLFYEGTPEDNELKYCPHCGAKVIKYESYIEGQIEIANKMEEDYLKGTLVRENSMNFKYLSKVAKLGEFIEEVVRREEED